MWTYTLEVYDATPTLLTAGFPTILLDTGTNMFDLKIYTEKNLYVSAAGTPHTAHLTALT